MLSRRKIFALFVCLFLIGFKVAAASIFVQAAIERAALAGTYGISADLQQVHDPIDSADDKPQFHTMNLMSHVTATVNNHQILVFLASLIPLEFSVMYPTLNTQNFPDSLFKPPKLIA